MLPKSQKSLDIVIFDLLAIYLNNIMKSTKCYWETKDLNIIRGKLKLEASYVASKQVLLMKAYDQNFTFENKVRNEMP